MTVTTPKEVAKLTPSSDDVRAIYEQDCEFVRHHDSARWSRVQMASVIEGAALYVRIFHPRGSSEGGLAVMAAATMALAFIFLMVVADGRASSSHFNRMRSFEQTNDTPFKEVEPLMPWGLTPTQGAVGTVIVFNAGIMTAAMSRLGWFSAVGL